MKEQPMPTTELVSKSFSDQCLSFPNRVQVMLAKVETVEHANKLLSNGAAMQGYVKQLRAGIDIERPVALGVLKIKAKIGEMIAVDRGRPKSGQEKGKGGLPFSKMAASDYRKIGKNAELLDEYYDEIDDVPSQADFIRYATVGPHVSNNSGQNEWYTPSEYVESARKVMGGIDVDPASSKLAQETVQAKTYYTAEDDGLKQTWAGRVWMNPPYSRELLPSFIEKLLTHIESGEVEQAIVLVNNATETTWFVGLERCASVICFITGRVCFIDSSGTASRNPLQGQAAIYVGDEAESFREEFIQYGFCR